MLGSSGVEVTAQDFTTSASQIAGEKPDAAFLLLTGPQYPVAIGQLKQAGFTGEIIGFSAMGAGNLASAGDTAAGAVWPTNFTATQTDESSQTFVKAYEEKYDGEVPNNYAAEAYDRMWFLARAIAEADSADRAAIIEGLADHRRRGLRRRPGIGDLRGRRRPGARRPRAVGRQAGGPGRQRFLTADQRGAGG